MLEAQQRELLSALQALTDSSCSAIAGLQDKVTRLQGQRQSVPAAGAVVHMSMKAYMASSGMHRLVDPCT